MYYVGLQWHIWKWVWSAAPPPNIVTTQPWTESLDKPLHRSRPALWSSISVTDVHNNCADYRWLICKPSYKVRVPVKIKRAESLLNGCSLTSVIMKNFCIHYVVVYKELSVVLWCIFDISLSHFRFFSRYSFRNNTAPTACVHKKRQPRLTLSVSWRQHSRRQTVQRSHRIF